MNWHDGITKLREQFRQKLQTEDQDVLAEHEEAFFTQAQEIIRIPEVPEGELERVFRERMEDVPETLRADCMDTLQKYPEIRTMFFQAMYVGETISNLNRLEDLSPAVVLYGKALEGCLRATLLPVFEKMIPDARVQTKNVTNTEFKTWTLGAFSTVLHREYCDYSEEIQKIMADGKMREKIKRSKLPCYVLYDQMNDAQQDKWNKLYRDVDRAKDLRNAACHYGVQLQAADSIELREKRSPLLR